MSWGGSVVLSVKLICRGCRKKSRLTSILKCVERKADYPSRIARRLNRCRTNLYEDLGLLLACGFLVKDASRGHVVFYGLTDLGRSFLKGEIGNENA